MNRTKSPTTAANQVTRELDARACEHALWISLLMAQRAGWTDILSNITLVHATASDRRRTLEALAQ